VHPWYGNRGLECSFRIGETGSSAEFKQLRLWNRVCIHWGTMKFFTEPRNPFLGLGVLIDRFRRLFAAQPRTSEVRSRIRVAFIAS
jgi:hypothetical protein